MGLGVLGLNENSRVVPILLCYDELFETMTGCCYFTDRARKIFDAVVLP